MPDKDCMCRDCGMAFMFTEGEQKFYATRQLSPPRRCKDCRVKRQRKRLEAMEQKAAEHLPVESTL